MQNETEKRSEQAPSNKQVDDMQRREQQERQQRTDEAKDAEAKTR